MSQNPQPPDSPLTDIFINYRRADTSGHAGRLERELSQRFPGRVFMDIHDIEVGKDFTEAISDEVGKCGAVIVLIGNQWLDITDPKTGKRRLDDPADFVALEIAGALKRNIRVIPVLVEGATMPQEENLPPALAGLVRRNAIEISDTRWDYDVGQLIKVLEKICGSTPPPVEDASKVARGLTGSVVSGKSNTLKIALVSGVATLLAVAALLLYLGWSEDSSTQPQANNTDSGGQISANVAATDNAAKPSDAAKALVANTDPRMKAVVNLSTGEAEFVFPFDTTGNGWEWFLEKTKVGEDDYHWNVFVADESKDTDYKFIVNVPKEKGDTKPKRGNFKSLLEYTYTAVQIRKGKAAWAELADSFPVDITYATEPDKFKIVVKGEGLKTIFARKPKEVAFMVLTPKQPSEVEVTEDVEYK